VDKARLEETRVQDGFNGCTYSPCKFSLNATKLIAVQLISFLSLLSRTTTSYIPETTVFSLARGLINMCSLLIAHQQDG